MKMNQEKDNKTLNLPFIEPAKRGRGRPRKYESAAERQKAYRERLKAQGKRTIQRVVKDVRNDDVLKSDIIDLSAVSIKKRNG